MTGRQNHCNREARDCTMNMNIHVVRVDIDIHGLGFDPKCSLLVQAQSESARESRLALILNLRSLTKYMILWNVSMAVEEVFLERIDGDSMPVGSARLAALHEYVPRRFWNARLVEQGEPAISYLRYTMKHVL
jgi:hypothetical protein